VALRLLGIVGVLVFVRPRLSNLRFGLTTGCRSQLGEVVSDDLCRVVGRACLRFGLLFVHVIYLNS
jgi:hypothetical protein